MDYKTYQLTKHEIQTVYLLAGFITIIIAGLFYRSLWGCVVFPVVYYVVKEKLKKERKNYRNSEFLEGFLNGIRVLNASLQAGFSMERAFIEVEKEAKILYGDKDFFYQEMVLLNRSVAMNISIEKLFAEFANRTGMEEIIQFSEILNYGKRTGGNWKQIIDVTVCRMNEKQEVRKQIEVMVAEKKLEQQVMNLIPLGILFLLQISSWEYMKVMYHNILGVCIMTIALGIYIFALYISEHFLEIKV